MELSTLTISEVSRALRRRECSVTELVTAYRSAAAEKDADIHAYLEIFADALIHAKKADEMLADAAASLPPLFGIPVVLKDNIMMKGRLCTAGSRMLENYTASYDATVSVKLKKQGAILFGRANMDDSAMGSSTESSIFGPTKNPHDLNRVPGGSSGGSAAAVAAGMCLGAFGSDTGGSIRQPAAFCGIVGMKPTYGRVSRHGLIAMASSLDVIGPLAKTVDDAEILFSAIAGGDRFDATAIGGEYRVPEREEGRGLKDMRIGVPKEFFMKGLDADVEQVVKTVIEKIEGAGADIREVSLPHSRYALPAYYIIVPSEVSANLARLDGIRYGYHDSRGKTLFDVYAASRAAGFGPEIKRRIMLGAYALSAGYYDAYYLKAQKVRRLIRDDYSRAFETVDILLGPTTPTPAFVLGERRYDPLQMYLADIHTVGANLAGVPALSLPAGRVEREGKLLPVGLQLFASWLEEEKLFGAGRAIEAVL